MLVLDAVEQANRARMILDPFESVIHRLDLASNVLIDDLQRAADAMSAQSIKSALAFYLGIISGFSDIGLVSVSDSFDDPLETAIKRFSKFWEYLPEKLDEATEAIFQRDASTINLRKPKTEYYY